MNYKLAFVLPLIFISSACGVSNGDYAAGIASNKAFIAQGARLAAKQRGIFYRAYGNEPFWQLEIDEKKNSILFKKPGNEDKVYPYIEPKVDIEKGRTVYQLNDSQSIVIDNTTCSGGSTGELYQTKVMLTLDVHPLNGCGRELY